jgi:uncharacterized spore protein YtfJ
MAATTRSGPGERRFARRTDGPVEKTISRSTGRDHGEPYGDPVERDGVTLIPAAAVQGGGGGGSGDQPDGGTGGGGGFGLRARPVGAFVIRGDQVSWEPAVDVSRKILIGQLIALVALLVVRSILRRR